MLFTALHILLSLAVFCIVTWVLIKLTYKKFANQQGEQVWKAGGGRTNYFRILALVSIAVTIMVMIILNLSFS